MPDHMQTQRVTTSPLMTMIVMMSLIIMRQLHFATPAVCRELAPLSEYVEGQLLYSLANRFQSCAVRVSLFLMTTVSKESKYDAVAILRGCR